MAIWNEIKKSINSNLNKPLDKLITESNTNLVNKLDTIINTNGGITYVDPKKDNVGYTNKYYTLPNKPKKVTSIPVIYNNEIHILGDNSGSVDLYFHYKWDGVNWSNVSTLPAVGVGAEFVIYNNEIHMIGGGHIGNTDHYKWDGSTWTNVSTLPYIFGYSKAVVYNNEIHILGSSLSVTSHYKWNGSVWTEVSTLPYEFFDGTAIVYKNELYIFGSGTRSLSCMYCKYNHMTGWSDVKVLPFELRWTYVTEYNGELYFMYSGYDTTAYYKYDGTTWTNMGMLPNGYIPHSVINYNNAIYMIGDGLLGGTSERFIKCIPMELTRVSVNKPTTIKSSYGDIFISKEDDGTELTLSKDTQTGVSMCTITTPGLYNVLTSYPYTIES